MPPLKNNGNQARIEHDGGVSGDKKHLIALMVFQQNTFLRPSEFLRRV
jgi:hypothetical protein